MGEDNNKILYISHKGEFLFWLIIVLFFVSIISTTKIFNERNDKNDYQIFLQDGDGLIVGSPVRMMGIDVGYVTKIIPIKDEVYVKFVITKPSVYIPQGTSVTVEFSGMAGSKSLELYLPNENQYIDSSTPLISINPPKRLHDAMGLLNNMFKKLGSIIYTTSDFGAKLKIQGLNDDNIESENSNFENFVKYSEDFLYNSTTKVDDIRKSLKELQYNDK